MTLSKINNNLKNEILESLKKEFKKNKNNILFDEIEIDDLSEDCFFKDAYIIYNKESKKIELYQKFKILNENEIENEISIVNKNYLIRKIFKLYFLILKEQKYNLYISVFKHNLHTLNLIKKLGFIKEENMYSFCIKNPYYKKINKADISNDSNYNGCYFFKEFENNDFSEKNIKNLLHKYNYYQYFVFFLSIPHIFLNKINYKITEVYVNTEKTKEITKKYFDNDKNIKNSNLVIINNISFIKGDLWKIKFLLEQIF